METAPGVSNSTIFLIAGGPGTGKGTLGRMLAEDYNFYYLSVGSYLRRMARSMNSQFRTIVQDCISRDELVPNGILMRLLSQKIAEEESNGYTRFIIDGLPRSLSQAENFDELFGPPTIVIWLQCPEDRMEKQFTPPAVNRGGVDVDLFDRRYKEFQEWHDDVFRYYCDQGICVCYDNEEESIEDAYYELVELLKTDRDWIKMIEEDRARRAVSEN